MKKLIYTSLILTGLLSSSSAVSSLPQIVEQPVEEMKPAEPIPAAQRCVVLREYYDGDHNNPDRSVFKHFAQWHEGDFAAVRGRLKLPENIDVLYTYGAALRQAFQNDTIDFAKLLLAYRLYSQVLSDDLEGKRHVHTESLDSGWSYLSTGVRPVKSTSASGEEVTYILQVLLDKKHRCLPIVSAGHELTTFRTLNESFGLKTPIVEMPLDYVGYDGQPPSAPEAVLGHDISNHMAGDSTSMFNIDQLAARFGIYGAINKIVRELDDQVKQAKCDFFLYLLGHEHMMDNHAVTNELPFDFINHPEDPQGCNSGNSRHPYITKENFEQACTALLTEKIEGLQSLLEKGPALYKGHDRPGSYMAQFVDAESERYCNLICLVTRFGVPKDVQINLETLRVLDMFRLPSGNCWSLIEDTENTVISGGGFMSEEGSDYEQIKFFKVTGSWLGDNEEIVDFPYRDEFINRQMIDNYFSGFGTLDMDKTTIHAYVYNQLLELQVIFQALGADFKVWDGDTFNFEGMKAFFEDARDTFVREVGPKFKGL